MSTPGAQSDLGEDVVTPPRPLLEQPPEDRFCDLVLTGGVASGVVYPWAVLELARHYRFKRIGGSSVGAMAAALAAAAEYGRRRGHPQAFEVLRRMPGRLAQEVDGQGTTRLLSLFQPHPHGRRLFDWFVRSMRRRGEPASHSAPRSRTLQVLVAIREALCIWTARPLASAGAVSLALAGAMAAALAPAWQQAESDWRHLFVLLTGAAGVLGASLALHTAVVALALWRIWCDLRDGLVANGLGLCRGGDMPDGEHPDADADRPALVAWLHEGIQRAAGLAPDDRPLSFRDLWNAPPHPGGRAPPVDAGAPATQRAIDLQMIVANVTLGRPMRLPSLEASHRLFFDPDELRPYFTAQIMQALQAAARPYRPQSPADPPAGPDNARLLELPSADLPVVVAARLSLSFPLLFSAVPLYAVDYEHPDRAQRRLERCWCSDGGLCSNFPIHMFDAAIPRWPTFGLWLGQRGAHRPHDAFWLPDGPSSGRGEIRKRFDPADAGLRDDPPGPARFLGGFLTALVMTAKDWGDYTRMRMPHVRNRVARLFLDSGEGGLNIGMSRTTMLRMAAGYGSAVGQAFVQGFGQQPDGQPGTPWLQQRWVRLQVLVASLRELMQDLQGAADSRAYSLPFDALLRQAQALARGGRDRPASAAEAAELQRLLSVLYQLEQDLRPGMVDPLYTSDPPTELRVRPLL